MKKGADGKNGLNFLGFLSRVPLSKKVMVAFLCFSVFGLFVLAALRMFSGAMLFLSGCIAVACSVLWAFFASERKNSAQVSSYLTMMTDVTGGCYWDWNPATGAMRFTPDGTSLFGRDVASLDDFISLMHPDDAWMFRKAAERTLLPDERLNVDLRMQSAAGEWQWFVARSGAVRYGADGAVVSVRGALVDIDDYRLAVDAMRASERRLSAIFKSAPGGMAVTDCEGRVLDANQAFYDMLGCSAEELQGVPIMSLLETPRGGDPGHVMEEILRECEQNEDSHFHLEEKFVCRDARRIVLDFGLSVLLDVDGNIQSYIFSGIDITLQKEHESELKLLTENQRWLFDFLRRFNEFHGVAQLFHALKENLSQVVSFSSLRLVIPSFMGRAWVMDGATDLTRETAAEEAERLLAPTAPLGESYAARKAIAWGDLPRDVGGGKAKARSMLAIPLIYRENTWGIMGLESASLNAYTEQDLTLMSIVGSNIGLYFEEESNRVELDRHTESLQQLHSLIHTLLITRNREHLLEGMLEYLKNVVFDFACAIYLFSGNVGGEGAELELLAWYNDEKVPIPETSPVLNAAARGVPVVEYGETGLETRWVVPIMFQKQSVGVIDLCKPSGLLPSELKVYQLLTDYVAGFWMLYDLMALREEEASVDSLTGIWNRRYMIRRLQEESDRITRYGGNACLIIGDMGNFKQINDNYGHTKGDEVLAKVAVAIKNILRLSDSVGRYGGDEFIVLLPNVSKLDADIIVNRMKQELSQLQIRSDDSDPESPLIQVVMDFGMALYPGGATTLLDTINLADEAMYASKIARKAQIPKMAEAPGDPDMENEFWNTESRSG
ncbi:MAG: diguanylate cyclase [Synergistaceae bacterium]|jgi:diguanylate cyclase (GGDEF)-like protein/PAS domain S-box-containing protein|nr:diguanylate cyclase [Synergistaceae bacterium]